ncbi:hypothetical protein ES695_16960 [Candidatus Atribacteria bacterium 1244-E10-H5-B2]|nr:MAG: hypothetical protein ES695_16960 [Candidatus Atribacteria bacterium 1244-E10-H5-B2]
MRKRNKDFMMVPNKFWEALYFKPLPCNERRVFDYIYRYTLGWGLKFKDISTFEISKKLGLLGSTVRKAIRELIRKRRIVKNGDMKGIQTDYTLWLVGQEIPTNEVGQERYAGRSKRVHLVGQEIPLIKDTLKDKKKRQENFYMKLSGKEIEKLESEDWYRAVMWNYGKFGMEYIERTIKKYDYRTRMSCWYLYEEAKNVKNKEAFFSHLLRNYQEKEKL